MAVSVTSDVLVMQPKNMKQKPRLPGFVAFVASCVVMLLAGLVGDLWTVFIIGLVVAGVSLFRD